MKPLGYSLVAVLSVTLACSTDGDGGGGGDSDDGASSGTGEGVFIPHTSSDHTTLDDADASTHGTHGTHGTPSGSEGGVETSSASATTGEAGDEESTWRVFVLSGQSNMLGQGEMHATAAQLEHNGGMGTLEYVVEHRPQFQYVVDARGEWAVRDDVWVVDLEQTGPLTAGFGATADLIGPELAFGHVVGEFFDDPVLIIKASWGGKSLGVDFRPPSAGGEVGPQYTQLVERVHHVLDNLATELPAYRGEPYRLEGIAWHQGWNDRIDPELNEAYESNAVHFINDLRAEFELPHLPFVLATTGMTGWGETHPRALSLMEAQLAVPTNPGLLEPTGVWAVETRDFWRPVDESPADQGYHWNRNAQTYLQIGSALAQEMTALISERALATPSYSAVF